MIILEVLRLSNNISQEQSWLAHQTYTPTHQISPFILAPLRYILLTLQELGTFYTPLVTPWTTFATTVAHISFVATRSSPQAVDAPLRAATRIFTNLYKPYKNSHQKPRYTLRMNTPYKTASLRSALTPTTQTFKKSTSTQKI